MFYEYVGKETVSPHKRQGAQEVLEANERGENYIITSVITHLEVLPAKLDEKGADDEADFLALFDAQHFGEIEMTANIIKRAREIRDHYYLPPDANGKGCKMMDLGDAIHLATATIHNSTVFHTRDNDKKGNKIPLLTLYAEYGETKLCQKYELKICSPESMQGSLDFGKKE